MRKILLVLLIAFACNKASAQQKLSPVTDPDFSQRDAIIGPVLDCEACREPAVKITLPAASGITVYSNNTLYYKQSITIAASPKLIRKIKAELTYFEYQPESDECMPCNKSSATFGNFANSTILNVVGTGTGTHAIAWTYTPPVNSATFPGIFNITLPPSVKCCTGTIRWCVRYVIEFDDCTVCSKTVCYEKKKTTTTPISIPDNPPTNPARQN